MNASLSPERAAQIRHLFDQVADLDPDERAAFLDQTCPDDPALRHAIETLLHAHERADEVLHKLDHPGPANHETPVPDSDRFIGWILSHYHILEKLGGGGMGVVYKAHDTKLDRTVALKFLSPYLSTDDEAKVRFIHEAKAASSLDHPNIGTIHEIDETDDGQLFIVMAFYAGETLKKKIARGPLPVDEALDYAAQVAQGLSKAHGEGIVHRDIKPANVMVTDEGVVKIVDFGLAKVADQSQLTKTGMTLGTVSYMSPEQARGEVVDHRTDLWSLGVVLYEMLTGQRPFQGDYEQAVLYSILHEDPEAITGLRTGVPLELERIVNKAMAKSLDERYQNAGDLLVDLKSLSKKLKYGTSKQELTQKNILRTKAVYSYIGRATFLVLLTVTAIYFWQNMNQKPNGADKNRIAVLPLANISADPENEYFVDGMTEELISGLSKISGLRVIARTSIMQYKGEAKSVTEIGRELKVGTVLEGSVRKAGNKLRITVQLIDAMTQEPLWSQDYDRELKDVFAIQIDIAQRVANALKVQLVAEEKKQIEKEATENLEAYTFYLKGRYFWNQRTEASFRKAIEYYERAIASDPNYALAYAGIADSYNMLGNWGLLLPKEAYPEAKKAARKALEIDETLAQAQVALSFARFLYDWDFSAGLSGFQQALEMSPNYAPGHQWYGVSLGSLGRMEEAISEVKRAQELDPLSLIINAVVGWMLYIAREYDQAIDQCLKTLEMNPDFHPAHLYMGSAYMQKGEYNKAINAIEEAVRLSGGMAFSKARLGQAYANAGKKRKAFRILDELEEKAKSEYVSPLYIARIYTALGEKDMAFEWLEKAYEIRFPWMIRLAVEPGWDPLRSDPRFTVLLKKMGLQR